MSFKDIASFVKIPQPYPCKVEAIAIHTGPQGCSRTPNTSTANAIAIIAKVVSQIKKTASVIPTRDK